MGELKERFYDLSDKEKLGFVKAIMPEICDLMKDNPQLMQGMMSSCIEMMDQEEMDMSQMMQMMGDNN